MDDRKFSPLEEGTSAQPGMPGRTTPEPEASEPVTGAEVGPPVPATASKESGNGASGEPPPLAESDAGGGASNGRRGLTVLGVILIAVGIGILCVRV
jgi:hypothetical protein